VIGDRLHDPDWVAVNVNPARYLPAPVNKIAGLTRISVEGAKLAPDFAPNVRQYAVQVARGTSSVAVTVEPTSTRSTTLTINGDTVQPGEPRRIHIAGKSSTLKIGVTSPDGTQTEFYTVEVSSR
jgi:hypothetical protein